MCIYVINNWILNCLIVNKIYYLFILVFFFFLICYIVLIEVINSYWDYNLNLIGIFEDLIEFMKVKY